MPTRLVYVKLLSAGDDTGPFKVVDDLNNVLGTNVSKASLLYGVGYNIDINANYVYIVSQSILCLNSSTVNIPVDICNITICYEQVSGGVCRAKATAATNVETDVTVYFYVTDQPYSNTYNSSVIIYSGNSVSSWSANIYLTDGSSYASAINITSIDPTGSATLNYTYTELGSECA